MRLTRVVLTLLFAAACWADREIRLSTRADDMSDNLWVNYLRGDTVQLYARESTAEGDPTAPASANSPDAYTWVSLTPDVVQVIGPGRLVMKGVGAGEISVRGPHATRRFTVWSYPPDAKLRFGPRDTTLNVGDIVTITAIVVDGTGKVIQSDAERQAGFAVAWGSDIRGPVLGVVNPSDARYWRAERSGFTTVMGGISLYERFVLRDSIKITVR